MILFNKSKSIFLSIYFYLFNSFLLFLKLIILKFPRMPKSARKNTQYQKRYAYFWLKILLVAVIFWAYSLLTTPFKRMPEDFQWILGLLIPLPKILFVKLYLKICSKAHGSIPHKVKVSVVHSVQLQHALFMVITMGFTANKVTSYTILGFKIFISLYRSLKIIYMLKYSKKGYTINEGMFKFYEHYCNQILTQWFPKCWYLPGNGNWTFGNSKWNFLR